MTDLRRIQRVLFRMQHDATLAARLRAREPAALASTGLGEEDLALLLGAPREGVEADPEGKRLAQLLRNVSSELALSVAAGGPELLASFPRSDRFHRCLMEDGRLPLAFGEHVLDRAEIAGDALLAGLARVELAMARLRRGDVARRAPAEGELVLAGHAEALRVPAGTMDAAARLRVALDAGGERPALEAVDARASEHVLVVATGAPSALRLRDVGIELLAELAGELLLLAREPVSAGDLAAFRAKHEVEPADLDEFVDSLVAEGALKLSPTFHWGEMKAPDPFTNR